MKNALYGVAIFALSYATSANSQCNVSADKKAEINALLCGQGGNEYPVYGKDCAKKSSETRFFDSAKQYWALKMCGFSDDAKLLDASSRKMIDTFAPILQCSDEKLDYASIYEEALRKVEALAVTSNCPPSLKSTIASKKPHLIAAAQMMMNIDTKEYLERSLHIKFTSDGAIVEAN